MDRTQSEADKGQNFLRYQLQKLTKVGVALSAVRSLPVLLEMILDEARELTNADGGTLYLVEGDPPESIRYHILQNATMNTRMGGTSGKAVPFPNLPLVVDGKHNYANVSAYTANTGKTINVPDWRTYPGFDFTGPKVFEESTGYKTLSLLVVAMQDNQDQIIGVLQLINALDPKTGEPVPFSEDNVEVIEAFGAQAAMAINNVRLLKDTENLFNSFAEVLASAIDERSKATSGHIRKVTTLTVAMAEAINKETEGKFADIKFSNDELEELRLAALLHDVGKVTTPLHVVEKAGKLQTIYDRVTEVETRFDLIRALKENEFLRKRMQLVHAGNPDALHSLDEEMHKALKEIDDEKQFAVEMNTPAEFVPNERIERMKQVGAKKYYHNGQWHPYLTEDELRNLTIQKGNITGDELAAMRDHARVSIDLLSKIPFTRKLKNIPKIAGAHHEYINGRGYPLGLKGDEITVQTRMMTIADIYEAVTAADRSYKKARSQEEAIEILKKAAQFGEIDPDLLELFIRSGVWRLAGRPHSELYSPAPTEMTQQAAAGSQHQDPKPAAH